MFPALFFMSLTQTVASVGINSCHARFTVPFLWHLFLRGSLYCFRSDYANNNTKS